MTTTTPTTETVDESAKALAEAKARCAALRQRIVSVINEGTDLPHRFCRLLDELQVWSDTVRLLSEAEHV